MCILNPKMSIFSSCSDYPDRGRLANPAGGELPHAGCSQEPKRRQNCVDNPRSRAFKCLI